MAYSFPTSAAAKKAQKTLIAEAPAAAKPKRLSFSDILASVAKSVQSATFALLALDKDALGIVDEVTGGVVLNSELDINSMQLNEAASQHIAKMKAFLATPQGIAKAFFIEANLPDLGKMTDGMLLKDTETRQEAVKGNVSNLFLQYAKRHTDGQLQSLWMPSVDLFREAIQVAMATALAKSTSVKLQEFYRPVMANFPPAPTPSEVNARRGFDVLAARWAAANGYTVDADGFLCLASEALTVKVKASHMTQYDEHKNIVGYSLVGAGVSIDIMIHTSLTAKMQSDIGAQIRVNEDGAPVVVFSDKSIYILASGRQVKARTSFGDISKDETAAKTIEAAKAANAAEAAQRKAESDEARDRNVKLAEKQDAGKKEKPKK